jgi:activator of 2-hydroxyglutaryl-CoA dehydratase
MCAVFAETEIIGLMAGSCRAEDIVAGAQAAIASRIAAMAGGDIHPPLAFTGGVAMIAGMDKALAKVQGHEVLVPPHPQFTGALGAALLASRADHQPATSA